MKSIKYLSVVAVASILGACAAPASKDLNVSEVSALPSQGNSFQKALHRDYAALAQTEIVESHFEATTYYNTKARLAAANGNVRPTSMDERVIPAARVNELTKGHASLMKVLNAGGATKAPLPTARAQTQFDCWMEESEENFQPDDIALCRAGFISALDEASAIVFAAAKPAPKVAAVPAPKPLVDITSYTIYFDHNSSKLNPAAMAINNEIIAEIKRSKATSVTVNGYTDRSGTNEYNRALAERRTGTVTDAINSAGIEPTIGYESFGENRTAVETADNVREWHNRRVVVTLKK